MFPQMYTLYYLLFNTVILKIVQHVSNYVTVHLQGSVVYYTSYRRMVFIEIC
jgi:hypothetical protein